MFVILQRSLWDLPQPSLKHCGEELGWVAPAEVTEDEASRKTDQHISQLEVSGPVTSVLLFQSPRGAAWVKHQSCCKGEVPGTAQGPCLRNSPCTTAASTDTHRSCSPDLHWELVPSLRNSEMVHEDLPGWHWQTLSLTQPISPGLAGCITLMAQGPTAAHLLSKSKAESSFLPCLPRQQSPHPHRTPHLKHTAFPCPGWVSGVAAPQGTHT